MVWDKDYDATSADGTRKTPLQGQYYHYIVHELAMKLNRGDAPIVVFVGRTNAGKSEKALRLVEILQEELDLFKGEFDADDQLTYEVIPFLENILNVPSKDPEADMNPDRKAFIFDEGGVNLKASEYHDDMNKAVDDVIQTMRIKNCLYLFCVPQLSDIDGRIQKNVDILVEVERQGVANVHLMDKNHKATKKSDMWNPIWQIDGKWYPDRPSEENRKEYKSKEYPFKEKNIEERLDQLKESKKQEEQEKKRKNAGSMMDELI